MNCVDCNKPLSERTIEKARAGVGNTTGKCIHCWHEARRQTHRQRPQRDAKPCTGCKIEKPLADFGKNSACIDGHRSRCRQCEREWAAQWREGNPGQARAVQQRYRAAHPELIRKKNKQMRPRYAKKAVERATAWARENPGRANANKARHNAAKLRATAAWANFDEIAAIYSTARAFGPGFHVDHIVPLQGKTVCGLHCEANLRIVPASLNISKHNVRWPDMFEAAK